MKIFKIEENLRILYISINTEGYNQIVGYRE